MNIEPFSIHVPDPVLEDLRARLTRSRLPDAVTSDWSYGAALPEMQRLLDFWRDGFDWKAEEEELNALDHFRAVIADLRIHFVHARGRGPKPMPILITHGWPGSFVEMLRLIPLLSDPAAHGGDSGDAFDVVVPSLPGYGFSDRPVKPGMTPFRIAALWAELMRGLGYERFGAQGGDWGSSVATCLGLEHEDRLLGIHLNYIPGSYGPHLGPGAPAISSDEQAFLRQREQWLEEQGGYSHQQRTFPQTLAFALNDSPAGLAGWIIEKFRNWSDCEGDVLRRFSARELLTNVMVYWVTETIGSSVRLYREGAGRPLRFGPADRVRTPTGVIRFAKEAPFPPRSWVERGYEVARWSEIDRGGHFASMEEPQLLAEDIRDFFRPLR